jgi:hypothetical protein
MNDETQLVFPPCVPAKPKGSIAATPKPTVSELEKLLNSEDETPVQILPDGTVAQKPYLDSGLVYTELPAKPDQPVKRRKRRTAAEMAAANRESAPVDSYTVYVKIVELLQPIPTKVRLDMLHMLMEYHT